MSSPVTGTWRCLICEAHGLNGLRGWANHYGRYHHEEDQPT